MIPREYKRQLFLTYTLLLIGKVHSQGGRTYDTSDWIPVTSAPLEGQADNHQETPNDRILSLEVPTQQHFQLTNKEYQNVQQEPPAKSQQIVSPTSRKLKYPLEYQFEAPSASLKQNPSENYYNGGGSGDAPYAFEVPPKPSPASQLAQQQQQNYFKPAQKAPLENYVPTLNVNPEVPPVNAPSTYEKYQPQINASLFKSVNPTTINDGLYQDTSSKGQQTAVPAQNPPSTVIHKTLPILEKHYTTQSNDEPKQNVQLVYVPVENLKPTQPVNHQFKPRTPPTLETPRSTVPTLHSFKPSLPVPTRPPPQFGFINSPKPSSFNFNPPAPPPPPSDNKKEKLNNIEKDFIQQALYAHKLQKTLQDEINPVNQENGSKRRRPHQPALAVFLQSEKEAEVNDVLHVLKDAKTISVQDTLTRSSPNIFIGPSTLESPLGYTKFALPYLNNLNGNRIERKIDQLPFFVAPASYTTPDGYSKIPLPSPHVGSIVVSLPKSPARSTVSPPAYFNPNDFGLSFPAYSQQNYINPTFQPFQTDVGSYQNNPAPSQSFTPPIPDVQDAYNVRQPQEVYSTDLGQRGSNQYRPTEENYRTTTPRGEIINEDKSPLGNVNSLDLAINNYELKHVNNQFVDSNKGKATGSRKPQHAPSNEYTTTTNQPFVQDTYQYTTEKVSRGRTRGRSRVTSKGPSKPALDDYKFTVLEDFLSTMNKPTESYYSQDDFFSSTSSKQDDFHQGLPKNTRKETDNNNFYQSSGNIYSLAQPQLYDNTEYEKTKSGTVDAAPEIEPDIPVQTPSPFNYSPGGFENPDPPVEYHHPTYPPERQPEIAEVTTLPPPAPTKRRRLMKKKPENTEIDTEPPISSLGFEQVPSPSFEQTPNQFPVQPDPVPQTYNTAPAADDPLNQDDVHRLKQLAPDLFQPNFDQTYISLQDQAVRSLLTPNILPLTTPEESPKPFVSTTEFPVEIAPSTETEKTTTTRGRGRGRGRSRVSTTTYASAERHAVTNAPRRTSSRRRPVSRTTTERVPSSTEYEYREDSPRTNSRQRTRSRGRPSYHQTTTTTTTTEAIQVIKEQPLEEIYPTAYSEQLKLESVQQYQPLEEQHLSPTEANYLSNPYAAPAQNTDYDQYNYNPTLAPAPVPTNVYPSETHPPAVVHEINTSPPEIEQPARYNNANIRSGGILNNNPETTTKSAPKIRGRTRGRSRFAISTTSTTKPRPVTRSAVTTPPEPVENVEEEFYGFIKPPSYQQNDVQQQYLTPILQEETNDEPTIQFVGEIRPKYTSAPSAPEIVEEQITTTTTITTSTTTEAPRSRVRSRTRGSSRITSNNSYKHTDNEVNDSKVSEQSTRRPIRTRGRGSSHYRAPENAKRGNNNEDVANQNYPVNFLQKFETSTTPKPTVASLQITIDPSEEDVAEPEDQFSFSSFYSAKIVPAPNLLKQDEKKGTRKEEKSHDLPELVTEPLNVKPETSELKEPEPEALPMIGVTENVNSSNDEEIDRQSSNEGNLTTEKYLSGGKSKGKRRGVWKLVRTQPVDPLDVSESQQYETVINDFQEIAKVDPLNKKLYTAKQSSPQKTAYNKANFVNEFDVNNLDDDDVTTARVIPDNDETRFAEEEPDPSTKPTFKLQESIFETIYEMFGITEKSTKINNTTTTTPSPTTTPINPTFPDEITEEIVSSTILNYEDRNDTEETDNTDGYNEKDEEDSASTEDIGTTSTTTGKYDVEPWKMKIIKTSTSTEISHETEICYKGRCVKSKGKPTTTK